MATNRYLEVIKRLLSADTYVRAHEEVKAEAPEHRRPEQRPKRD